MHLSNYNLFSFLVPEGEVLGNQTYSSHWNPVSSSFHSGPFPVYLEELGLYVDISAILKNVLVFHTTPPAWNKAHPSALGSNVPFQGKKIWILTQGRLWSTSNLAVMARHSLVGLKAGRPTLILNKARDPSGMKSQGKQISVHFVYVYTWLLTSWVQVTLKNGSH